MKYNLKSLYIDSFKAFNKFTLEINNKLTVLIGENGTGKTTILEIIYNMIVGNTNYFDNIDNVLSFKKVNDNVNIYINNNIVSSENDLFKNQKVIYFPTEVTFLNYRSNGPTKMDDFNNDVTLTSEKMSKDFKQFLVNQRMLDLNDISNNIEATRIEKYKKIFNEFLRDKEFLEIDLKTFEPMFRLKDTGKVITTDELSSGEKQVFFKGGSLLQYGENKELIVLIDEPEISMHPEWQQVILRYYTNINPNCQFIFSTHSSQIVSCCKKEEIRLIEKVDGKLQIKNDIIETYGLNDEELLFNIFNLKSVRNREVDSKIEEYKSLYCKFNLNDEEKEKLKELKEELKAMNISENDLEGIDSSLNTEKLKMIFERVGGNNA